MPEKMFLPLLPWNFSTSHPLELEWDGINLLTEMKKQCTHSLKKEGAINTTFNDIGCNRPLILSHWTYMYGPRTSCPQGPVSNACFYTAASITYIERGSCTVTNLGYKQQDTCLLTNLYQDNNKYQKSKETDVPFPPDYIYFITIVEHENYHTV